ncbi:hypothetical protein CTheo_4227 [Ceratobasidium theobromae]|uniref:GH18 domain-containing protein n=1 Tax=Ceratobasidium theobromae TaxID=1582974 RepID=A0A5N5QMF5_9AGAM|nr:hypothetical protein CTheo_4227 [Ceratobasidium theobromae]
MRLLGQASLIIGLLPLTRSALVDLTKANRRPPLPGLPDWSKAGFEGGNALPDDSKVAYTLSAAQLASSYGVVADDGQDDTAGLQNAITAVSSQSVPDGSYRLIQLPAGTINLSYMIYVDTSYLIIRGTGNNPNAGGTKIIFRPDADTKYDKIINDRWDLDGMEYGWDFRDENGDRIFGTATGGWLWPGRSIFRVGSSRVARKYEKQHNEAPRNRKDLFKGTVNYHWRSDEGKRKGWMVAQEKDKAGSVGTSTIHVNGTNTKWVSLEDKEATDVWIASPVKRNDYVSWGVETNDWFQIKWEYSQDWFTITEEGVDANGPFYKLDHPLRFDVYRSSTGDGSTPLEDTETFGKAMPIAHVVHHVGIENLYMTHEIDGLTPESAQRNYGNLAPEQAMHGIVFRYARDSWVRNIQTFMTGSHPIATEAAKNIQIQDNYFDGAWNKGKGGNGYLRGSRVWDSLYYNNTLRNLRHITMQWCSMGNVIILNNMTNDMNLHGGWEGFNLFELNYVSVPYSHRSGSCSSCGGEGGDQEAGTWFPIWWGAGEKASKWSGATGPRNIFYRNYMIKQQVDSGEYLEYLPYFARDGSLSSTIWQMGWDNVSPNGLAPIKDWQSHEQVDWSNGPAYGANSNLDDAHTSLFLKDVSAAKGTIAEYSSIAGNTYCRGDVEFAYGVVAKDGTISVATQDQQLLKDVVALKAQEPSLKVFLAVGGWGMGADPANLVAIASSSSARTKLGTSGAAICQTYGLDGIDLEWATGISATQWKNIAQTASTGLKASNFNLSISTPHSFWSSSGINTVAADIAKAVDFMSLISHDLPGNTLEYANSVAKMTSSVAVIHKLGFPRTQIMMGVPFYGRSRKLTDPSCTTDGCSINAGVGSTSECIGSTSIGQGTFPYFAIDSRLSNTNIDIGVTGSEQKSDSSGGRFITDSGYVFDYETPQSVVEKARAATMLCASGLTDQDNRDFDLTNAIWQGGALIPTAAEIAETIKGEPLDSNGLVSIEFWNNAADQIIDYYPDLPMTLSYQVMILLVVRALDAVANSLTEYLRFSALTEDSFQLYKKWETKALNWALANETGKGNDYWQCSLTGSDLDFVHETCPGGHNTPGADVDDVFWKLVDSGGFSNYLTDALGFDTSELLIGNVYVGRNPSSCFSSPFRRQLPANSSDSTLNLHYDDAVTETNHTIITNTYLFEDDGTGRIRRIPTGNSSLSARNHIGSMPAYDPSKNSEGFSPYDPDEKCRTEWHNILVVDSDKFFPNIKDGIQAFLDQYDDFKSTAVRATASAFETTESLGELLHVALTTLVSGNDTLSSTMDYIEQVKYDQYLQGEYDRLEEQARKAAILFIVDLVITLLSFVPFGGLVSGAARAARALMPLFKSARATRSLVRGFEKAAEGAADAKNIQSVDDLLSPTALTGRGQIGKALDRIQEVVFECGEADFIGQTLDLLSLGESVLPSSGTLSRRLDLNITAPAKPEPETPRISVTNDLASKNMTSRSLTSRATARRTYPDDCIWLDTFKAKDLKTSDYKLGCHRNSANYPMSWLNPRKGGALDSVKYTDCRPTPDGEPSNDVDPDWKDEDSPNRINDINIPLVPGQCDHMLEANEVVLAFKANRDSYFKDNQITNKAEQKEIIKDLCEQPEYKTFFDELKAKLNSDANQLDMRPLFGPPNVYKASFISPNALKDKSRSLSKWNLIASDPDTLKSENLAIMDDYMAKIKADRQSVAKSLDSVIQTQLKFADDDMQDIIDGMGLGKRDVDVGGKKPQSMGFLEEVNYNNYNRYLEKKKFVDLKSKLTLPKTGNGAPVKKKVTPNKKRKRDSSGLVSTQCKKKSRSG